MPVKFGLHAFHFNLYLHEFFEPILFNTNYREGEGNSIPISQRRGRKCDELTQFISVVIIFDACCVT